MKNTFSGSTEITDAGIKEHFKNTDSEKAIFELVWNGLDAKATHVSIIVNHNEVHGLESVTVLDNGDGIDFKNIDNNFGKFNESLKKSDDNQHGSHGRGRLAFHKLSNKATWYTKHDGENAIIRVDSNSSIKDFEGDYIKSTEQHGLLSAFNKGTCVELSGFTANRNLPVEDKLLQMLSIEFGWYLALNNFQTISLNGRNITVPVHDLHESVQDIDGIKFSVKIFRWNEKPTSEKSYNYLVNSENKVVYKELSRFNQKLKFYTTAYATSQWADDYTPNDSKVFHKKPNKTNEYRKLSSKLLDLQRNIYEDFLRTYVDDEIQKYDDKGFFPKYSGVDKKYAEWRKDNTKQVLKEIYLADPSIFNSLNAKQATLLIRLLDRILISNENDGFYDVLDSVVTLGNEKTIELANQLKKTSLDNLVSTIEILHKRELAIQKLREVMENHYKEVLETPDLQKIIEANTWLFGSQYTTLGAEEDTFQSIAKKLRDKVKGIDLIEESDITDGNSIDGVNRQVDLFLARRLPFLDSRGESFYKCVIIEIKRPSISLNKKHLRQLEDYEEIITKHPAFSSDKMKFELILVGRKVSGNDTSIGSKLHGLKDKGESGLVGENKRIKSYIKTWATIFDEFELSNNYLLGTLNSKLECLSNEASSSIVGELQEVT